MSVISLTYDNTEIIQDVIITDAQFESEANGVAGLCNFRVKDDGHTYPRDYFKAGGVLALHVDDQLVWAGAVMSVGVAYAFAVDDTSNPQATPRFYAIQGADWNILFSRRVVFDKAAPTTLPPTYPGNTSDETVVLDIANNLVDLSTDGIDLSGVTHTGPISAFGVTFRVINNFGQMWGEVMNEIVANLGTIYYIDPDKVFQYRDTEVPRAPFVVSDRPASYPGTAVGCRDMVITSQATEMINDAMVWGAGMGSGAMVFARVTAQDWIDNYGTFQSGDLLSDVYLQPTVQERAESLVYGSPTNHRGHVLPQDEVRFTLFQPGIRVGMVVEFYSAVFDSDGLYQNTNGLGQPITDPPGVVPANLANFMERIRHIESNGNYTDQNTSSGAYGAYQIMPGNWGNWATEALGLPKSSGVSGRYISPSSWYPPPTQANQDAVATFRFTRAYGWLGDWRRVAALWRAGASEAIQQPVDWSQGSIFYVNHACVPLGYPVTTTATVLPPLGSASG